MALSKSFAEFKVTQKELYGCAPRPRNNDTFKHSNIFDEQSVKRVSKPFTPHGLISEKKQNNQIRENDTTRSYVFYNSDISKEQAADHKGKKTYPTCQSPKEEDPKLTKNIQHRIKDHNSDFFYQTEENDCGKGLQGSKPKTYVHKQKQTKAAAVIRLEQLYNTEIAYTGICTERQFDLNPRREIKLETNMDIDKKFTNASEMRNKQNQSNILFDDSQKPAQPLKQKKQEKKFNKETASISEYNQSEMNRIKKLNHNFSDIFGLEYGQRGELKGRNYELKTNDTPKSNNVQMRNTIMDQKSSLDTHSLYDNQIQSVKAPLKAPVVTNEYKKPVSKW